MATAGMTIDRGTLDVANVVVRVQVDQEGKLNLHVNFMLGVCVQPACTSTQNDILYG